MPSVDAQHIYQVARPQVDVASMQQQNEQLIQQLTALLNKKFGKTKYYYISSSLPLTFGFYDVRLKSLTVKVMIS